MFLSEKSELEELKEKFSKLELQNGKLVRGVVELAKMVKPLENRNGILIDITAMPLQNNNEEQ